MKFSCDTCKTRLLVYWVAGSRIARKRFGRDLATSRPGRWVAGLQLSEKNGKCDLATSRLGRRVAGSQIPEIWKICDFATSRLGRWVAGRDKACRGGFARPRVLFSPSS